MKHTVQEKYEYNKGRQGKFPLGYCCGVSFYRDYMKFDQEGKGIITDLINHCHENALLGDELSKGVMCGYRDCANERKSRYKR